MSEDKTPNESAIALRMKQTNRYITLALIGILAICGMMFLYISSIKQSEQESQGTKQALAETTLNSATCNIYPDTESCSLARDVAADPSKVIQPTNGVDGKPGERGAQGAQGRGVTAFSQSSGDLIVTYTDGQTQNVGKVVGKDGATGPIGPMGPAGRGILSTTLQGGALVVNFTDGESENLGIVVGPAGNDGQNGINGTNGVDGAPGKDGIPGANGKDGISVIDVKLDATNTVQVYYSDGTIRPAGQLIISTIKFLSCPVDSNVFTIGMTDGTSFSTTVDCSPDDPIAPAPAQTPVTPAPAASTPAATTSTK